MEVIESMVHHDGKSVQPSLCEANFANKYITKHTQDLNFELPTLANFVKMH